MEDCTVGCGRPACPLPEVIQAYGELAAQREALMDFAVLTVAAAGLAERCRGLVRNKCEVGMSLVEPMVGWVDVSDLPHSVQPVVIRGANRVE